MPGRATGRRSGGAAVVEQLRVIGTSAVFCVPGESYLPVLDALGDVGEEIRTVVARHEGAATTMAEAHARTTGGIGVAIVTRGPGVTQASVGLHHAWQASTPVLLLVGGVRRSLLGRDAFQELDCRALEGALAKRVERVSTADRLPEVLARAAAGAVAGRPGPVIVEVPEDVLTDETVAPPVEPSPPRGPAPAMDELARLETVLAAAERPLVIVGGGGWSDRAERDLAGWLDATGLPVAAGFRRADVVDHNHPGYAGHLGIARDPRLAQRVRDADLLVVLGSRLGEVTTGAWTLVEAPVPRQRLVHAHPDAATLGAVARPNLGIVAATEPLVAALRGGVAADGSRWRSWREQAHRDAGAFATPGPIRGELDLAHVVAHLGQALPDDAVVTSGAGNYALWLHRHLWITGRMRHLAPQSGAMGYGLPAAIAASVAEPERTTVAVAGDGCAQMTGAELATAVQERCSTVLIVVDNGRYGTVRMHQERRYPGRTHATDLDGPDFVAWGRAHGAHAERVERTAAFPGALERALATPGPSLLHLPVDPDRLTPESTVADEAGRDAPATGG